jgi:hypothetical protein
MNTAINVIQVVIGIALTFGGVLKIVLPYATYSNVRGVPWAKDFKWWHIKLIGVLETSGGVGLLAPLFVPSLATFVPLAAVGIALYMAGAMATHLRRSEYLHMAGLLIVFLVPALLVAYNALVGFTV